MHFYSLYKAPFAHSVLFLSDTYQTVQCITPDLFIVHINGAALPGPVLKCRNHISLHDVLSRGQMTAFTLGPCKTCTAQQVGLAQAPALLICDAGCTRRRGVPARHGAGAGRRPMRPEHPSPGAAWAHCSSAGVHLRPSLLLSANRPGHAFQSCFPSAESSICQCYQASQRTCHLFQRCCSRSSTEKPALMCVLLQPVPSPELSRRQPCVK